MSGTDEPPAPQEPGGPYEEVGGVAEEAAKLLGALAGWARDQGVGVGHGLGDLAGHAAAAAHEVDEHLATGATECTYCPLCRGIDVVRGISPDVREHLGVAATALVRAAAGLLATAVPEDRAGHTGSKRGRTVQHIDLEDDWTDDEWPDN